MSVERITVTAGPWAVQRPMEARGYTNARHGALALTCNAPDGAPSDRPLGHSLGDSLGHSLERWRLGGETLTHPFILAIDPSRLRAGAAAPAPVGP